MGNKFGLFLPELFASKMAELRCHGNTSSVLGVMGKNFFLSQKSECSWNENGGRNAVF